MKHVLFVSNNPKKPSHIEPAIKKGYTLSLIKTHPEPHDYDLFDNVIDANLFDVEDVVKKTVDLNKKHKIDGVLTRFEPYTPLVGAISDKLNLPGPSLKGCINCRNKLVMRKALQQAGVDQPKFYEVKDKIPKKAFPLLIKPTKGAKSRYILRIDDPDDLSSTIRRIEYLMQASGHTLFRPIFGIDRPENNIILEEILSGVQVTTTSYVVNNKVFHIDLADIVTSQDIGMDGFHLISRTTPSVLSPKYKREIKEISTQAINALGINNSCLHPEIMLTNEGSKVLEVAARIGGYRPEMTNYAFGIDMNEIAIDVSLGIEPKVKKKHEKASTAVEVWPHKSGRLKGFRRMDDVIGIKGVKKFQLKNVPGNIFHSDSLGVQPIASFYTVADSPNKSKKIAAKVLSTIEPIID